MTPQRIFVKGVGRGGNHEAMGVLDVVGHLLLVDEIARLALRGLFPRGRHPGFHEAPPVIDRFGSGKERQLALPLGDGLGIAINQVLRAIAAIRHKPLFSRLRTQATGQGLRGVRGRFTEAAHHHERVDVRHDLARQVGIFEG